MSKELAVRQLADLAQVSQGAVEVLGSSRSDEGTVSLDLSLDTSGIETVNGGIHVRDRERFKIVVSDRFPHVPPSVTTTHRRWAGTPHVQWGGVLCLYAATSVEWNPSDGMRGLIERLVLWLERAAAGTLDAEGQPLHPPVAYPSADAGVLVVRSDVGPLVPWGNGRPDDASSLIYAWCIYDGERLDVLEWLGPKTLLERVLADEANETGEAGRRHVVAAALFVSDEIAFEYPRKAAELVDGLSELGITRETLLSGVTIAAAANGIVSAGDESQTPVVVLLGTPSRRVSGSRRLAHLSAWRFNDLGEQITSLLGTTLNLSDALNERARSLANDWLDFAKVRWMTVHEDRPEVTNRRDADTAAAWLRNKRVLVLGCGALGAPIAEQCVRAGVTTLTVADHGVIKPGLLVRQPYHDSDIGRRKAEVLAARLTAIRRDLTVSHIAGNVLDMFMGDVGAPPYDLVIDATANVGVRTAIEASRARDRQGWPPVICGLFSYDASRGVALLSRTGATGGPHDVLRRVAIDARGHAAAQWADIASDIFPDPPRSDRFFPEPGCSEPTFVGGATQTDALASSLFWATLNELSANSGEPMVAIAIRLPGGTSTTGSSRLTWLDDTVVTDTSGGYEIRMSVRALAEMRAEVRRGARTRGPGHETGGMLLGSFDDGVGCIYVDVATGPSPDSVLSPMYFGHGTDGTQDVVDHHRKRTARRVGFVGMWHTHPGGRAHPSEIDTAGMGWLVSPDGAGRRALMVILGGAETNWSAWREDGSLPDVYVEVVDRDLVESTTVGGQIAPAFIAATRPGGYYQPEPVPAASWWRRVWGQQ